MRKIHYIKERISEVKLRNCLSSVVDDVESLIPQCEDEFVELQKLGLYPAEQCVPFITKQGTPFYQLDNMSLVPKGETSCYLHYGAFEFRQIEVLFNMVRMDSVDAHHWLKNNLFQGCRVDSRKKMEYKSKFKGCQRGDWRQIQTEWMKYCLMLKYRDNALFRRDLEACGGRLPIEDATETNYASRLFWGAELIELDGMSYYFGCNVLGKLLAQLRTNSGKLDYQLPADLHLFGEPILAI